MVEIIKFRVCFRRPALHLIRKKYPRIGLFGINFTNQEGHDLPDPDDGVAVEAKVELKEDVDQTMANDLIVLEDSVISNVEINSESLTLNHLMLPSSQM